MKGYYLWEKGGIILVGHEADVQKACVLAEIDWDEVRPIGEGIVPFLKSQGFEVIRIPNIRKKVQIVGEERVKAMMRSKLALW